MTDKDVEEDAHRDPHSRCRSNGLRRLVCTFSGTEITASIVGLTGGTHNAAVGARWRWGSAVGRNDRCVHHDSATTEQRNLK